MVEEWEVVRFIMLKAEAACYVSKRAASVKTLLRMSV